MTHPSLKDVAARAGVSFQTTSKVLNGKGTVSAETRQRILAVADELGYVPNALARSLLSRSTCTIGVVASDFTDTVLTQVVVGVEREARRHGHCVIIGSVDREGSDGERYLRVLLERRVDGIVMIAPKLEDNPRVGAILRGPVPAVSTHQVAGGGVPVVTADHLQVGRLVVRHLTALGHRRIGTVTGPTERRDARLRLDGYRQALGDCGLPFDSALVEEGDWSLEGGYQAGHRLLDRAPDVTAVFAQSDTTAMGLLAALHDRGRRVPDDCAVVGCDDLPLAARTIPPLTTIRLPFYEAGETAARLLLDTIAGRTTGPPPEVLLPVRLVYRSSSGAPGADPTAGLTAAEVGSTLPGARP